MANTFLLEQLPRLPDDVVIAILELVPQEHLLYFCSQHPDERLRRVVFKEFFGTHTTLRLSSTVNFCSRLLTKHSQEISGPIDCFQFASMHMPLPLSRVTISGDDLSAVNELIENITSEEREAPRQLEVSIEGVCLRPAEIDYYLSIPYLITLDIRFVPLEEAISLFRSPAFSEHPALEQIVLIDHETNDWLGVRWPRHLKSLDLSWSSGLVLESVDIPPTVLELYLNGSSITSIKDTMAKVPGLKTLMLSRNNLPVVNVDDLPRSLVELDMTRSAVRNFEGAAWPPTLKSILLGQNEISTSGLADLLHIAWPPTLQRLVLDNNNLLSLGGGLSTLPSTIECLSLSDIRRLDLRTQQVGEYPYYVFPSCLRELMLLGVDLRNQPPRMRLILPSTLECLEIVDCKIPNLGAIEFPQSLQSLLVDSCRVEDLTSYDGSEPNSPQWTDLSYLRTLMVTNNYIRSLAGWNPPPQLQKLDLSSNRLKLLTSSEPLFSRAFADETLSLQYLNTSFNPIHLLDLDFVPQRLVMWECSSTRLGVLKLQRLVTAHPALKFLNFKSGRISDIDFEGPSPTRLALLQLNLVDNNIMLSHRHMTMQQQSEFAIDFRRRMTRALGKLPLNVHLSLDWFYMFPP